MVQIPLELTKYLECRGKDDSTLKNLWLRWKLLCKNKFEQSDIKETRHHSMIFNFLSEMYSMSLVLEFLSNLNHCSQHQCPLSHCFYVILALNVLSQLGIPYLWDEVLLEHSRLRCYDHILWSAAGEKCHHSTKKGLPCYSGAAFRLWTTTKVPHCCSVCFHVTWLEDGWVR